jgi:hypothetical protein
MSRPEIRDLVGNFPQVKITPPSPGDTCNSCGLCCLAEQCAYSLALFGEQSMCPALTPEGNTFRCGLMTNAAEHCNISPSMNDIVSHGFRILIGSGTGCDAGGEWTDDQRAESDRRFRQRVREAPADVQTFIRLILPRLPEDL